MLSQGHSVRQCHQLRPQWTIQLPTSLGFPYLGYGNKPHAFYVGNSLIVNQNWLLDSNASHYVSTNLQNLSIHSKDDGSDDVIVGNGNTLWITQTSSAQLPSPTSHPFVLSNVLCVPDIK